MFLLVKKFAFAEKEMVLYHFIGWCISYILLVMNGVSVNNDTSNNCAPRQE